MARQFRTIATVTIAFWAATALAGESGPASAPDGPANPPGAVLPPGSAPPGAGQAGAPPQSQGTPALVLDMNEYESLLGKAARAITGEDLGRIIDVIVDRDGRPRAAIIDFGGFLGVGSRKIAVDWRVLKFSPDGKPGPVTLQLNRNQVRVSPEYKPGEPIVVLGSSSPGASAPGEADTTPATEKGNEKAPDKQQEKTPEK